ncbi:MAG: hypothetical protein C0391_02495 [Anaerolinea sp.]|nr:hypothetical protein [Anaerolinea sp.]
MDILRDNLLLIIIWSVTCLLWTAGGFFIVHRIFCLDSKEELITGFGVGLISYLFLCNISGRYLVPTVAFTLPSVLIFTTGFLASRRNLPNPFIKTMRMQWVLIATGLILGGIFFLISRGISLFDEPKNLSIISQMGRGIIPPTFESTEPFGYHYGFQLLSASLMAIGGFFPWSAFDMGKAIVWGYTIILFVMIANRYMSSWWKSALAGVLFVFAGGTRYLLFLFPSMWMTRLDTLINLKGTSSMMEGPLSQALRMPWVVDGGPPGSYIFGLLNGINPNYVMAHTGTGTLSITIILLFWLLLQREISRWSIAVYSILLAFLALTWESSFGLFGVGMGITGAYYLLFDRQKIKLYFTNLLIPGLISLFIACFQGGVITDRLALMVSLDNVSGSKSIPMGLEFWVKSPLTVESAHLGSLSLDDPLLILTAIAELGIVVFFVPFIIKYLYSSFKKNEWFAGIMIASSIIGFIVPLFIGISSERDITRVTAYSLGIWIMIMTIQVLSLKKWNIYRCVEAAAILVMSIGGLANLQRQLPAILVPIDSYYVNDQDAAVTKIVWGNLPIGCKVFDPKGFRAVIITGCSTEMTFRNTYTVLSTWQDLKDAPSIKKFIDQGYQFVYLDEEWMGKLPRGETPFYRDPCVRVVSKQKSENGYFLRRLVDLRYCQQ